MSAHIDELRDKLELAELAGDKKSAEYIRGRIADAERVLNYKERKLARLNGGD